MGVPVILTKRSLADLARAVSFIAKDGPERALSFGNELIDRALRIGAFPEMGRKVPEFRLLYVREVIKPPYRIISALLGKPPAVYIIRFWHSARGRPEIPILPGG